MALIMLGMVFLPIDNLLNNIMENFLLANLLELLIFWFVLLLSLTILICSFIDEKGFFYFEQNLIKLISCFFHTCFVGYGISLVFDLSFEYTESLSFEEYQGSSVVYREKNWGYFNGTIGTSTFSSLKSIHDTYGLKVLELDSQGGLIGDAVKIAEFIKSNKIFTAVNERCESACVLIAISGRKLFVKPSAQFGFHNASSLSQTQSERGKLSSQVGSEVMFDFLKNKGIPDRILKRAKQTPASSMFYVSGADLIRYGLAERIE